MTGWESVAFKRPTTDRARATSHTERRHRRHHGLCSRVPTGRTHGQRGLNSYTGWNGKRGNGYRCDRVAHGLFNKTTMNT